MILTVICKVQYLFIASFPDLIPVYLVYVEKIGKPAGNVIHRLQCAQCILIIHDCPKMSLQIHTLKLCYQSGNVVIILYNAYPIYQEYTLVYTYS